MDIFDHIKKKQNHYHHHRHVFRARNYQNCFFGQGWSLQRFPILPIWISEERKRKERGKEEGDEVKTNGRWPLGFREREREKRKDREDGEEGKGKRGCPKQAC